MLNGPAPTPTHPGGTLDTSDVRRRTIAEVWRAIEHATTADECRTAVAWMGNRTMQEDRT